MDTPKQIGRYEILEELGHGAMGTVYRAKDPAMDRVVALKTIISLVLASEQGSEFRERFYREARASGKLAHPGIVAVFDVGEHQGLPFLVMEFVDGRTLADAAKKGERMTLDRICEIGQQIAEALGHAHHQGVVHRDIKPANILLTSREAYGIERPKITDFGVAKLAAGHTTMTGQILGTPAFMPPEQFTGAPIDGRADLFSLGVVLYWLATGEQPFPGEGITAVSYKVVHTDPVPPRKLNPAMPAKLEAIIMKCLAKAPDERFQSGEELARELAELRAGASGAGLRTAAPQAPAAGSDTDVTLVEAPSALRTGAASVAAPPMVSSQVLPAAGRQRGAGSKSKSNSHLALVAVAVTAVLAAGWFVSRHRRQPPLQQAASPAAETSAAPPASTPGSDAASTPAADESAAGAASAAVPASAVPGTTATAPPSATATPSANLIAAAPASAAAAKKLPAAAKSVPANTKPADNAAKNPTPNAAPAVPTVAPPPAETAPAPAPAAEPAAVDFDPKSLDPRQNAKLKIEADQVPPGLDFTLEMNGKIYLRRSAAGEQKEYDNLFVPPGVQEFRVAASSGAVQKVSNTVSTEFKAKKRNTLKIELRAQGQAPNAGVPQGLYPNTQIVLTLK
jgi:eukaryotic-like serine/threonine-protein kinase